MAESGRMVYLVDDDEAIRRSAGFMLKTSGFTVKSFVSGVEFLKEVKDLEPGCILLDIRMPGLDGLEVQKELHSRGVPYPVVVMTGHGDVGVAVQAMKAGAVDFIEKPFEKAVMLSANAEGFAVEDLSRADTGMDVRRPRRTYRSPGSGTDATARRRSYRTNADSRVG